MGIFIEDKVWQDVKSLLSYNGNVDSGFINAIKNSKYNKRLAKKIILYYEKEGLEVRLGEDGIITILCHHQCKVKAYPGSGYPYLHIYNYHGALIYPVKRIKKKFGLSAYMSRNGYWQIVGSKLEDCIVTKDSMKSWETM